MRNFDTIRNVVRDTLSNDFDHIRIIDVRVCDDVDSDGSDVLRIDIIFEGDPKDLDAMKLSGAIRQLRPKLGELDEFAFPILSFISKVDARPRKRASA